MHRTSKTRTAAAIAAALGAALVAACSDSTLAPPTAPPPAAATASVMPAADVDGALASLASDAVERLVPSLSGSRRRAVGAHLGAAVGAIRASDRSTARREIAAAARALDAMGAEALADPDIAALSLDLDALRAALEDAPSTG